MVNGSLKKLDRITKKGDTYSIETKHTNGIRVMEIITRKEAKEKGLTHYFTGKPCKYGHVAERLINGGQCCACYAEYQRKYREQNKEKLAEKDRKYRAQNKEKIAEKSRKYYEQNKDELIERRLKYVEQNKETIAEYKREYYEQNRDKIAEKKRKYVEKNKEKIAEYKREYYEQNRDKIAEKKRKYVEKNKEKILERKTKYRKANPEQVFIRNSLTRILTNWKGGRADAEKLLGYTCEQLREHIESQFKDGMSWDDRDSFHIDHIKPIKAFLDEGITDPAIINALDNLQPLWAHENLSKGAKYDG